MIKLVKYSVIRYHENKSHLAQPCLVVLVLSSHAPAAHAPTIALLLDLLVHVAEVAAHNGARTARGSTTFRPRARRDERSTTLIILKRE